jgi:glycosyltransferase involved in cell wall biosynthesis
MTVSAGGYALAVQLAFSLLTLAPGEVGGSETYARALLAAFAGGIGPNRVIVLADSEAARGLTSRGSVEIASLPYGPGRGTVARAAGLARGLLLPPREAVSLVASADAVHFPLTVPIPRGGRATVVTLHDVLHLDLPGAVPAAERAYRRLAYDRAAHRATRVIAVSAHARERIVARLGIAPEHVTAIPHGIDHARFAVAGDDRELDGLPLPTEPYVLYPANLWPHKNHVRLLEALARARWDGPLVLTGATYGRLDALRSRADRLGVGARVQHLGYVPAGALAPLYRHARAVVFPSLYEGFGAPPLEAMACGTPVAASDAGAVAEACGGAALAFDAGDVDAIADALTRVTGDDALRSRLREAGLARAAELTWERSAAAHAEVYADAATSSARRS